MSIIVTPFLSFRECRFYKREMSSGGWWGTNISGVDCKHLDEYYNLEKRIARHIGISEDAGSKICLLRYREEDHFDLNQHLDVFDERTTENIDYIVRIFINDNYEGGIPYFTDKFGIMKEKIKPRTGDLLIFDPKNISGDFDLTKIPRVTKVTKGEGYIICINYFKTRE